MTTRAEWASDFLNVCGLPVTQNNLVSIVAWIASEDSHALFNPLDTTRDWPDATAYNNNDGNPVKNYPTYLAGLAATKATLENGYYTDIIDDLRVSAEPATTCGTIYNSPWGSKPSLALANAVKNNFAAYSSNLIAGTTVTEGSAVTAPATVEPPVTPPVPTKAPAPPEDHWPGPNPDEGPYNGLLQQPALDRELKANDGEMLTSPVVCIFAPPGNPYGYYMATADGNVYQFGQAKFYGSVAVLKSQGKVADHEPIVSAFAHDAGGYTLVTADGVAFFFGDAQDHGSFRRGDKDTI